MVPKAIECDKNDRNNEDLDFLSEIRNEVSSLSNTAEGQNLEETSQNVLRRNFSVYHGMRRNSSFADYFEGDLSQNLLSRRHFYSLNESSTSTSSDKEQIINNIVDQIKDQGRNNISAEGKLKKFSEVKLY